MSFNKNNKNRSFFKNENFIKEIFTLLDFTKSNLVDFRDFVRLVGILKSDNLEAKLRLCFKSYDINNKGYLDKVTKSVFLKFLSL